jgi:predicted aminopeptidase
VCVQCVMMFGCKTLAMKVEEQRLEWVEKMMMRRMCGVTLKDQKQSEELRERLAIVSVSKRVRQGS